MVLLRRIADGSKISKRTHRYDRYSCTGVVQIGGIYLVFHDTHSSGCSQASVSGRPARISEQQCCSKLNRRCTRVQCCKPLFGATALCGDCRNPSVLFTSDVSVVVQSLCSNSETQQVGAVCAESRHNEISQQWCWMKIVLRVSRNGCSLAIALARGRAWLAFTEEQIRGVCNACGEPTRGRARSWKSSMGQRSWKNTLVIDVRCLQLILAFRWISVGSEGSIAHVVPHANG